METLAGRRLARRELAHPHGTQAFTRSATVELPTDARHVVVPGHDREHGYGGQAAVADLTNGETERIRQEPRPTISASMPSLATLFRGELESLVETVEAHFHGRIRLG
ncbi:hypothetical protein [Thiohalorhabdus sp.]|uniref:hypothetical protein n=1 Tax=Thiohalorhabdus sp. TaxID=3094134 RepID=UPI002FC35935